MTFWAVLLLAADSPTSALSDYGPIGIVAALLALAVGVLFKLLLRAYDRERDRADRLERELSELKSTVMNQYVSTLSETSKAVADALTLMRRER